MILKLLEKATLLSFLDSLLAESELCAPVRRDGGGFSFSVVESAADVALDYRTTVLSPKKFLLPPRETIFRFRRQAPVGVRAELDERSRVVFGVHPCDINALWMLDAALSDEPADALYEARRSRALIIGLNCLQPCDDYAFCGSMGSNVADSGFDLMLNDVGDAYVAEVGTSAGLAALARWGGAKEVRYEHRSLLREAQRRRAEEWPRPLDVEVNSLPRLLEDSYDSLLWEVLGEKCLGCGSCTLVCPTCYCFDVWDELDLDLVEGKRVRRWDSCQLRDFALVAGGENFREKRSSRTRHRFFRKVKWLPERYGRVACVGCGRCSRACLAKINPIEVYNQLRGGVAW